MALRLCRLASCATLLAVANGSCGGGGSGGGGATATPPASLAAFAADYCSLFTPCCMKAGLHVGGQGCQVFVEALAAGQTYNAGAGQACVHETQQLSTQQDFCSAPSSGPSCRNVFSGSGTKGPGQPCATTTECAAPAGGTANCWIQTTFVDGGTTSSGSCIQLLYGMVGQGPCLGTVSGNSTSFSWSGSAPPPAMAYLCNVADGVSCNSPTRKCTALSATSQACTQSTDCVAGDYCSFATSGSTCVAHVANGASCAGTSSNACLTTSYCDTGSQTCKPLLAGGSVCTLDMQCQSHRCINGMCGFGSQLSLFCAP
jgi:hypothetical protein